MSYLFFAGEFAEKLIGLGHAHAQRWIDEHPADPGSSIHHSSDSAASRHAGALSCRQLPRSQVGFRGLSG